MYENSVYLPYRIRHAIRENLERRRSHGNVSTSRVIRDIQYTFPDLYASRRELQNVIARAAIPLGLQIHFDTEV